MKSPIKKGMSIFGILSSISFIWLFIAGCGELPVSKERVKVKFDTLRFPLGDFAISDYFGYHAYYQDGVPHFMAYNHISHSLDLFDVATQANIGRVPLAKEGPDGIASVSGMYFHNQDSIFLSDHIGIYLLGLDGKIRDKKILNHREWIGGQKANEMYTYETPMGNGELIYLPDPKAFLVVRYNKYEEEISSDYFSEGFASLFYWEEDSISDLPFAYPEYLQAPGKVYAHNWYPQLVSINGSLLFSFQSTYTVYAYHLATQELSVSTENSAFTGNLAEAIPASDFHEKGYELSKKTVSFFRPLPATSQKLLFRLHREGPDSEGKPWATYLTIYDANLGKLMEMPLSEGKKLATPVAFVSGDALMLPLRSEYYSESYLTILRCQVNILEE